MRTAHFFEANGQARKDVLEKCTKSDIQYQPEEECGNAIIAEDKATRDADYARNHPGKKGL